jgi:mannose-6-phosphate isomerase
MNNSTYNSVFYPLAFNPIFKERIWGGTKLKSVLNKEITSEIIGESWEISTVPNDISVVSNGIFEGKNLNELIIEFPNEILGIAVYEQFDKQFPLLFKYLDAKKDLSIQVHPNDELAAKRHNSFGKTEMWYIMQADDDARIIVGFKENSNADEYVNNLKNQTLLSILDEVKVKKGDVFFLETGTVHAIGAGMIVAEIQQTSDITYRIYDFNRRDTDGNERELHIDLALDAINYNKIETQKQYKKEQNKSNEVVDCKYFTTNFIPLNGEINVNKSQESFTVYMCTEGNFKIITENEIFSYKKGDTILIPAILNRFSILGKASILEIYIS